jgi:hypothetical protein
LSRLSTVSLSSLQTTIRKPGFLVRAGALLIILWLIIATLRISGLLLSLYAREGEARSLMTEGLAQADPDAVEALVLGARTDVARLKTEARPFLFIGSFFGWLPKVGPILAAAPHLMEMGDAGSEAAAYAWRALKPGLILMNQENPAGESRLPAMIHILNAGHADLVQAAAAADRATAAHAKIQQPQELPARLLALLDKAGIWLPVAHSSLEIAQMAPTLMGAAGPRDATGPRNAAGPRTYLIMVQNQDELRATGGFISSAGLLIVEQGQIIAFEFADSYTVDDYLNKPYGLPPEPLYEFMLAELFGFRDANFWPDFPTSAEKSMTLYTYGQEIPLDGVMAVDQEFVRLLVTALGELTLPDEPRPVTGRNIIPLMRSSWQLQEDQANSEWFAGRKSFIGEVAAVIRSRLESDPGSIELVALAQALQTAVDGKHLQVYLRDPALAAAGRRIGWDGRLDHNAGQDYLMVVDSNVGFNKVNAIVDRSLLYEVALAKEGGGQARVTVNYQNQGNNPNHACRHQGFDYGPGITYDSLIYDCYWNFLRVYTPKGSELLDASLHPIGAESLISQQEWNGRARREDEPETAALATVFGNLLLLPQGQSLTSYFTYKLPATVIENGWWEQQYRLTVHKQAGAAAQPLEVRVTLPAGATFKSAIPSPTAVNGPVIIFNTSLAKDLSFQITYRH